ncbi:MAG: prolipoprotein diacylglyceryl transferase [Kiloniellales bacterium]
MLALPFLAIDPVAIQLGPLAVRWYALAYVAGIVIGWRYCLWLCRRRPALMSPEHLDQAVAWIVVGIVIGGRLGYVLFYNPAHYLANPLQTLYLWRGGMSFHGGLAGVLIAMWLFARRRAIPYFRLTDVVGCGVPLGLFFGRVANFINGELFGRVSELPWAVVFPQGGPLPRHPSQLYEAALEGIVLFLVLAMMERAGLRSRVGLLSGVFMAGYGLARLAVELVREPDPQIGYLLGGVTMGQLLSLPVLAVGVGLIAWSRRPGGRGP